MSLDILTISQINEHIRVMMEEDQLLTAVAVRGEISNYKVYPSGHHYFTLKDDESSLKCVMFRGNAVRLRFRPDNGMQIIAMGRISIYPKDGVYQLYCTALVPEGVGDLYAAFERLKERLSAKGFFDPVHKKPLPQFPERIGIITSSAGAAIHDILRILKKRYPICSVSLLPVRVQGAEAPMEIAEAIAYANRFKLADLLIVGRGGGSIEDLWAFNDEQVAQAIFESKIPVISAVGHEPDVTIADYVADLRAATPSNAAELAVPDQDALRQTLDAMQTVLNTALQQQLKGYKQQLSVLSTSVALYKPDVILQSRKTQLNQFNKNLIYAQKQNINKHAQKFFALAAKLDALSPLKVLSRGYAMVRTEQGSLVRSVQQIAASDKIQIRLSDGTVTASVTHVEENVL